MTRCTRAHLSVGKTYQICTVLCYSKPAAGAFHYHYLIIAMSPDDTLPYHISVPSVSIEVSQNDSGFITIIYNPIAGYHLLRS